MPQVNISVAQKIDDKTKNELQLEIAGNMAILPGKSIDNTTICILDGCSMFRYGKPYDGAFADIRLYKASPEESKREFASKLFSIMQTILKIDPEHVNINFVEMSAWASGGKYF